MEKQTTISHIEFDIAGFGGRPRYTCWGCGATIVRQPYMTNLNWKCKKDEFFEEHENCQEDGE